MQCWTNVHIHGTAESLQDTEICDHKSVQKITNCTVTHVQLSLCEFTDDIKKKMYCILFQNLNSRLQN